MKLFARERLTFPEPRLAMAEGIVDLSDDLRVERLLEAYSFGIFPWPHEDLPTIWYCPEQRGILNFADMHVSRSLRKFIAGAPFTVTCDRAFAQVIEACARASRPHQQGTWITSKLERAYLDFHQAGYAHSIEVWENEELVGGLYGVYVAGLFCGESMFYKRDNASKFALVKVAEFLQSQGLEWMDIQMVTPLLENMGGVYISRDEFLKRLEKSKAVAKSLDWARFL
ncbi:MAG: leucyl/phenylalanyl-tRNA--protein transferase [Bdellovibrionales bacterium]|nr:leucyl/phenylalanyl-tRNA--protein transferase [Bdellovibrionales bacterium]